MAFDTATHAELSALDTDTDTEADTEAPCESEDDIEQVAAEARASGDNETLLRVVILASLEHEDAAWITQLALELTRHTDPLVRGNSNFAFSHVARRFRALDEAARPVIERGLLDDEPWVFGKARYAAHDLRHFLGWSFTVGQTIAGIVWTGDAAGRSWRVRHERWIAPGETVEHPWSLKLETTDDGPSIVSSTWWSPPHMLGEEPPGWSEQELGVLINALGAARLR